MTSAGTIRHRAHPVVTPRRDSHLRTCRQSPTLVTRVVTGKSAHGVGKTEPRVRLIGLVGLIGLVWLSPFNLTNPINLTNLTNPNAAYVVNAASTPRM